MFFTKTTYKYKEEKTEKNVSLDANNNYFLIL